MAMLRTLGWFTEILIGSLLAQLCDHAVQQLWAQQGGGLRTQAGLLDDGAKVESLLIRQGNYNSPVRSGEELWAELKSTVSEADALLGEFQRWGAHRKGRKGSFCGCVRELLGGRESDEELAVARTRAVRRRLRELAGAAFEGEVMTARGLSAEPREVAIEGRPEAGMTRFLRSLKEWRRKKDSVWGIAGVVVTYVWWVGWMYSKCREIPGISLIPSTLLEYLE